MRPTRLACAALIAGTFVAMPRDAAAQAANPQQIQQQIDQLRQEFNQRISALESQLAALQGGQAPPAVPAPGAPPAQTTVEVPPGAAGAGGPAGPLPIYGNVAAGSKIFNPDMAVIGDFLGAAGRNKVDPQPALEMHESEASFQAIVDPYARADFFISFGEEGVDLEEGFLTLTSLPGGFLTKVGKMRANFGKVNALHNHVLPWTDRPMVTRYLVGGEDGIDDAGFSVARLIPAGSLFLEATGEVYRGDSGESLFKSRKRGDLSYVGHLRGYQDITESTNLDLGASYSYGHTGDPGTPLPTVADDVDLSRFTTQLFGIDATLRWKPLSRAIYHSFTGRSEVVWSRRQQFGGRENAMGYYVSGDYQFARRWFVGGRYDRSAHAEVASVIDKGASALLTYWPSEFSQVRGQYRRTNYAAGPAANELLFQFQFSMGAHGAHPF